MSTCALAELGLTAFLIEAGNEHHTWPSPRYHSLYVEIFRPRIALFPTYRRFVLMQTNHVSVQLNLDIGVFNGVCVMDNRWSSAFVG